MSQRSSLSAVKLLAYEKGGVYGATFIYDREKHEFNLLWLFAINRLMVSYRHVS